jgi:heavy metal translocating P-type ATPase
MIGVIAVIDRANWNAIVTPIVAVLFVIAGAAVSYLDGSSGWAERVWLTGLVLTGAPLLVRTSRLVARRHFATDIVATLAIVGAVGLGYPLAGLIVVLMQTGGEALERIAEGRASRAVRALEADAPRIAHIYDAVAIRDVAVEDVRVGDEILIRPGEMIPCDCVVTSGESQLDTSRLTGEPLPVTARAGTVLMSGVLNLNGALIAEVTAVASESQYARIVELVRTATASKSPLQRLADRYAVWFTPATLVVCALAWYSSGDPTRALAVLVVATPCPLILATPIAIIGGINRAARRQIIMRTGGALERLSGIQSAVFDKTGTVTGGRAEVSAVVALPPFSESELLRLAGSLEQHSSHALAPSVVEAATRSGVRLSTPSAVMEDPGRGITGMVDGRAVAIGSHHYIAQETGSGTAPSEATAAHRVVRALIAIDGSVAGTIEFTDQLRPGAQDMVSGLRRIGVRRLALLSGDHADAVRPVATRIGVDDWQGELLPVEKLDRVARMSETDGPVLMLGDGTNDAPALSRADVGIALAGHGGGVTAEAADIVILTDDLSRVVEAVDISRRTMRIARQSIWVGLSLSAAAMAFAAMGRIPPVAGALLQEGIDVAVILNALRASIPGRAMARWRVIHRVQTKAAVRTPFTIGPPRVFNSSTRGSR